VSFVGFRGLKGLSRSQMSRCWPSEFVSAGPKSPRHRGDGNATRPLLISFTISSHVRPLYGKRTPYQDSIMIGNPKEETSLAQCWAYVYICLANQHVARLAAHSHPCPTGESKSCASPQTIKTTPKNCQRRALPSTGRYFPK
jgi:hypothetical protein